MEKRWLYVTSEGLEHLRDAVGGVCVVPMGAIEKHGLHLPLGADTIQAETLSYLASQQEPVCVFPTIPQTESVQVAIERVIRKMKDQCSNPISTT